MLVFIGMIGWALLTAMHQPKLGLAMLFGVGFGLLIERAQICFTSAFRDLWISGRAHMAKAIIFGMAVSAIGIFSYVQLGVAPKIMWAGRMRSLADCCSVLASCWRAAAKPAGCTAP